MDPLWLLLLLPLAVASGWYASRRDAARRSKDAAFNLPSAYFKGLNFLLNEQPDKAIEVFIKVLEVARRPWRCTLRWATCSAGVVNWSGPRAFTRTSSPGPT